MSEEQLNALLEKVKADTSLQEKLKAAASPDAAIETTKEAGFAITAEDIQSMQSATVELSEDELEGAAGGYQRMPFRRLRYGALLSEVSDRTAYALSAKPLR